VNVVPNSATNSARPATHKSSDIMSTAAKKSSEILSAAANKGSPVLIPLTGGNSGRPASQQNPTRGFGRIDSSATTSQPGSTGGGGLFDGLSNVTSSTTGGHFGASKFIAQNSSMGASYFGSVRTSGPSTSNLFGTPAASNGSGGFGTVTSAPPVTSSSPVFGGAIPVATSPFGNSNAAGLGNGLGSAFGRGPAKIEGV